MLLRKIFGEPFAPFGQLRIEFPSVPDKPKDLAEVHLLTGVNGCGKTRILCVLSAMLGNANHLMKRMRSGPPHNFDFNFEGGASFRLTYVSQNSGYNPTSNAPHYNNLQRQLAFAYSGDTYVTDTTVSPMGAIQPPNRAEYLAFNRPEASSPPLLQLVTNLLFQAAVDSLSANSEKPTGRAARIIKSLEETLFTITARKFQFVIEQYPSIALFVVWGGIKLSFIQLPDGLRAIIGWLVHAIVMTDTWLQGKGELTDVEATFLIDEPESHLHPAWQRKILPAFQRLFPKAQIFVATHSPFVIASLNHGWIHSFKINGGGVVVIEPPKAASQGDSYISVVEEIMGVKEWFDPETENLLAQFRAKRDAAYAAENPKERETAYADAQQLGVAIGKRSTELDFMMGKELNQMRRQFAQLAETK